ncbi:MAG: hypothetical protein K8W52_24580 [Deltaproteobacteria bacterium]|nr:hypothetical protein [Deltaproteobacteria bacterium]
MRIAFALALSLAAAACGGDSSSTPDAAGSSIDAKPADVEVVSCTGVTPAQTITVTAVPFAYSPASATINVGDVVHFQVGASHPTASGANATADGKWNVAADGCLKFTKAGTYPYFCVAHGFTGTLTVQ